MPSLNILQSAGCSLCRVHGDTFDVYLDLDACGIRRSVCSSLQHDAQKELWRKCSAAGVNNKQDTAR